MGYFLLLVISIALCFVASKAEDHNVKSHVYDPSTGYLDVTGIDELIWKGLVSMSLKTTITACTGIFELPIKVYSEFLYKRYKSYMQRQTRISSITALWTPTSDSLSSTAAFIVVDGRFDMDNASSITGSKTMNIKGQILSYVPFDPNFQQLLTGSIHIATATVDINKIKFYLVTDERDMSRSKSVSGFLDMSWKTIPDNGGVYLKKKWDVFTFPRVLPSEIANNFGKNAFEKYKRFFKSKYDKQKNDLASITEIHNDMIMGSDQGYNQLESDVKNRMNEIPDLLKSSSIRIKAIKLTDVREKINSAVRSLKEAMTTHDINKINESKLALTKVARENNIELPADLNGMTEEDNDGHIIYGEAV